MSDATGINQENGTPEKLRIITYLSPGVPLGIFQMYQRYLEETLGMDSYLMVESRYSGPPVDKNPFDKNEADIAFMCSTAYLQLHDNKNSSVELLPVAPIHIHPKSELRPVYFTDLVVHSSKKGNYKDIHDLKGHKWAYNDEASLSGNIAILNELKKMGESANFFGHTMKSGSHHNSLELIRENRVDVAGIDSIVFHHYKLQYPERKDDFHVLCSLGPFPVQPIVVNPILPAKLKQDIAEAFLNMNKCEKWNMELQRWQIWGFKPVDESFYEQERQVRNTAKNQKLNPIYY